MVKKVLISLFILFVCAVMVYGEEITKTFAWDAPDATELNNIKAWELRWSAEKGGP